MSAYDAPADLVSNILAALNRLRPGEYQRVGNLIEQPRTGVITGEGRMLSTSKMASTLHAQEVDPDVKAPTPPPPPVEPEPKKEELKPTGEEQPLEEPTPTEDEGEEEFGEADNG